MGRIRRWLRGTLRADRFEADEVDAGSVSTEELNRTTKFVGPGHEYQSFAAAMDDLRDVADGSNRFRLVATDNIEETETIEATSHVDMDLNGFTLTNSGDYIVDVDGEQDGSIKNGTLIHDSDDSYTRGFFVRKGTDETYSFEDITVHGQSNGEAGIAIMVRNDARPKFSNVTAIGGAVERGGHGFYILHNAAPSFEGCSGIGGAEGDSHGWVISDACYPTISGGEAIAGPDYEAHAVSMDRGRPAPTIDGLTARYPREEFWSTVRNGGEVTSGHDGAVSDAHPTFLEEIHYRIRETGADGATLDIGTSPGANDIVSGAPVDQAAKDSSNQDRIFPDFDSTTEFDTGDGIYYSLSDSDVVLTVRYTVGYNRASNYGYYIDTEGTANITNFTAISNRNTSAAVYIDDDANDAKNYALSNGLARTMREGARSAVRARTDDGSEDPIENVTAIGGFTNVTPRDA